VLVQVFAVHKLVDGVDQTVADGQPLEVDLDRRMGVVQVDGVRYGRHVLAGVRLAGHVEIVVRVLVEQREELYQRVVHVEADGRLAGAVAVVVAGEAEARAHRIVHVQHRVRGRPRVVAQLQPVALAHRERAVLVEHGVQAGRARAALQPQQHGRGVRADRGREEPEEHVGTVPFVHGQVTRIAVHGAFHRPHLARGARLVDPSLVDHGRQVQGAVVFARRRRRAAADAQQQ